MNISKRDFEEAARCVISAEQTGALWSALEKRAAGRQRFDLPHVAYYLGALVVILAMSWFMNLGWARFGGWGIFAISASYGAAFLAAGSVLWRREGLRVPGGLLVTLAVCITPLAVYGFERATGLWLQSAPGDYLDFDGWLRGSWFAMEAATIIAGLLALRFFRFPFLTAPVIFTLWFAAMDVTPLIFEREVFEYGYKVVSLVFGLALLLGSYLLDVLRPFGEDEDFTFWGYLFGTASFWGGLTTLGEGTEAGWLLYAVINALMVLFSVFLRRRVLIIFGSVGLLLYTGHLAYEIFEGSILFPFALSAVGLCVVALGILYARRGARIEQTLRGALPEGALRLLPRER